MPLQISTDPAHWCGALPDPRGQPAGTHWIAAGTPAPLTDWFQYCNPALNQRGESCVGWAWAHWLTAMVRRYQDSRAFAGGWQLDGEAIWTRGRQLFWGGTLDSGLFLPQGFDALRDLGGVPDGECFWVSNSWDAVGDVLLDTPLVQAHAIHAGWFRAAAENGCIDHEPRASASNGYHATLRIGRTLRGGSQFYAFQNSWGEDWGYKGYGLFTAAEDAEGIMAGGLCSARLPAAWRTWDGWTKLLKKAA